MDTDFRRGLRRVRFAQPTPTLKCQPCTPTYRDLFVKTVTEFIQNLEGTTDDSVGFLLQQEPRTLAAGQIRHVIWVHLWFQLFLTVQVKKGNHR